MPFDHAWDLTPAEARSLQGEYWRRRSTRPRRSRPGGPWRRPTSRSTGGATILFAAVVVVLADTFEPIEEVGLASPARFPYVPGFALLPRGPRAARGLRPPEKPSPDVVLCDGQGVRPSPTPRDRQPPGPPARPADRRLRQEPTLRPLRGARALDRGDRSPLLDKGETIGVVLRTRDRVAPLFVSPGHRCDQAGAEALVLATTRKFRLPIPARLAHDYVNEVRRAGR